MFKYLAITLVFLTSSKVFAGPWIPVGDSWLRSDIEYLANTGVIDSPITTWPLMWSNIKSDIESAAKSRNFSELNKSQQDALIRVRNELLKATKTSRSMGIELSSDPEVLRGFHNTPREESTIFLQQQKMEQNWAYNLQLNYLFDPFVYPGQEEESVRLDGSYVTAIYDNLAFGFGWIDKWWGPGKDSSLILSSNARPRPGLFIQRNYAEPFETEWLSWMGPWTFQAFAEVLDDNRTINDAKLLGLSVSFKPLKSLEIGLRRTAQWGGEGRPQSFSSLVDLFFGRDNCGSDGISECGSENSNEPGNQLAGVDLNYRIPTEFPLNLYTQIIGEDEADFAPSRRIHQLGVSGYFDFQDVNVNYFVEYIDTTTSFSSRFNYTYEHYLYSEGYRYSSRSLGSTVDNDSRAFMAGLITYLADIQTNFAVTFKNIQFNVDDEGFHTISLSKSNFRSIQLQINHQKEIGNFEFYITFNDTDNDNLGVQSYHFGGAYKYRF